MSDSPRMTNQAPVAVLVHVSRNENSSWSKKVVGSFGERLRVSADEVNVPAMSIGYPHSTFCLP